MRILGIDPGSIKTGYAIIDYDLKTKKINLINHGVFFLTKESQDFSKRLFQLYQDLESLLQTYQPTVLSIEKIFFAKNALSALTLGHARGVVLVLAEKHGLSSFEYNPTQVKSYLIGKGRASKDEIARYLELIVGKQNFKTHDASDALSLSLCHAYAWSQSMRLNKNELDAKV